jgi:hypothetical protein
LVAAGRFAVQTGGAGAVRLVKANLTVAIGDQHKLKSGKHDDDTVPPPTPGAFYYSCRMVAEVVRRKGKLISAGECGAEDGATVFGCGSDCDGGT